jgi:quercetin dioxygenase-like cupin family protein
VYGGHEHRLRQTLIGLVASSELAEHESPGEATLYVLSGHIRVRSGNDTWEGHTGDMIVVPPARHDLHAVTDAAVLLTVATKAT